MGIMITIPSTVTWKQFAEELRRAAEGEHLNYQVQAFPLHANVGDRCYICYRGYLRGWHEIVAFSEKAFTCTTTGKEYAGKFIERTGKLQTDGKILMAGFRGFRYRRG